jgi:hypothetical protein
MCDRDALGVTPTVNVQEIPIGKALKCAGSVPPIAHVHIDNWKEVVAFGKLEIDDYPSRGVTADQALLLLILPSRNADIL